LVLQVITMVGIPGVMVVQTKLVAIAAEQSCAELGPWFLTILQLNPAPIATTQFDFETTCPSL